MNPILALPFLIVLIFGSCKKDDSKQDEIDRQKILTYISDNNLTAIETNSGLFYVIENPGTGNHPAANATVIVRYTGYYTDGTIFDSNEGEVATPFNLQGVIRGWQEGIPLFKKGGIGKLLIPSKLGYGSNSAYKYGIPNNSILLFDIRLVDFY